TTQSTLTASPASIPADNSTTTTLNFTPKDSSGNPVKGMSNVTFAVSGVTGTTVGPVTENNGVYTATLTGSSKGSATVTANANGTAENTTTVTLTATQADLEASIDKTQSTLTASPSNILADGNSSSTLTFTPKDSSGNPVKGLFMNFTESGVTRTTLSAVTESNGVYTATLKGSIAGSATVTVNVNGTAEKTTTVILSGQVKHIVLSTDYSSSSSSPTGTVTATFRATDENGDAVIGIAPYTTISSGGATYTTQGAIQDNGDGNYTFTINLTAGKSTSTYPNYINVNYFRNGVATSSGSVEVTFDR
ncbi:invasin domain 3-containing protein, partial [Buttiauxella gaviniae]|uniref:invasin domain 3-containing protein n=1 Tax=Buttiauxella gaviniae TaxID=82990 RepID=UPI000B0B6796